MLVFSVMVKAKNSLRKFIVLNGYPCRNQGGFSIKPVNNLKTFLSRQVFGGQIYSNSRPFQPFHEAP